jgi:hypothetical protein
MTDTGQEDWVSAAIEKIKDAGKRPNSTGGEVPRVPGPDECVMHVDWIHQPTSRRRPGTESDASD